MVQGRPPDCPSLLPAAGGPGWLDPATADQLVECEIVDSISTETVRQTLKKTNSSPG